jgi:CBS domain-containing protein
MPKQCRPASPVPVPAGNTVQDTGRIRAKTVRDVMKQQVVTVVPEMTVRELVQTFLEEHVRGAPVLGPTGKVIGIVSEADVLRVMLQPRAAGEDAPGLDEVRVGEIMGPVGLAFSPGDAVTRVARTFAADGVQRVVVIENDILLGIVTPADLMRSLDADA